MEVGGPSLKKALGERRWSQTSTLPVKSSHSADVNRKNKDVLRDPSEGADLNTFVWSVESEGTEMLPSKYRLVSFRKQAETCLKAQSMYLGSFLTLETQRRRVGSVVYAGGR